jgi:rhodanese-related sulfurtransferase
MEIVFYCANMTCHASENAADELTALGYANVRYYPGGKHDWVTAGLAIERSALVEMLSAHRENGARRS